MARRLYGPAGCLDSRGSSSLRQGTVGLSSGGDDVKAQKMREIPRRNIQSCCLGLNPLGSTLTFVWMPSLLLFHHDRFQNESAVLINSLKPYRSLINVDSNVPGATMRLLDPLRGTEEAILKPPKLQKPREQRWHFHLEMTDCCAFETSVLCCLSRRLIRWRRGALLSDIEWENDSSALSGSYYIRIWALMELNWHLKYIWKIKRRGRPDKKDGSTGFALSLEPTQAQILFFFFFFYITPKLLFGPPANRKYVRWLSTIQSTEGRNPK